MLCTVLLVRWSILDGSSLNLYFFKCTVIKPILSVVVVVVVLCIFSLGIDNKNYKKLTKQTNKDIKNILGMIKQSLSLV